MARFPLTVLALAALDSHASYSDVAFDVKQAQLLDAVGAAFAADTADFNRADLCRELCAHSGGLAWVRDVVARC